MLIIATFCFLLVFGCFGQYNVFELYFKENGESFSLNMSGFERVEKVQESNSTVRKHHLIFQ